jgi:hypothetical protein
MGVSQQGEFKNTIKTFGGKSKVASFPRFFIANYCVFRRFSACRAQQRHTNKSWGGGIELLFGLQALKTRALKIFLESDVYLADSH